MDPRDEEARCLISYFREHRAQTYSIEIIASSTPLGEDQKTCLFVDDGAVAIRKRDLVKVFVTARNLLLPIASRSNGYGEATRERGEDDVAVFASRAVQLYDPEHLTAANYRKRVLANRQAGWQIEVEYELLFVQSLLTSPLHKHTKSPTLWHHRYWIMESFCPWRIDFGRQGVSPQDSPEGQEARGCAAHRGIRAARKARLWFSELDIILMAGSRHEKNYHAFQYARKLLGLLWDASSGIETYSREKSLCGTIKRVTAWCLAHPTDISGFTFLAWLIRERPGDETRARAEAIAVAIEKVEDFKTQLQWKGKSVETFLKAAHTFS